MATDLSQKQGSGQTKVVGADANGVETNYAAVTAAQGLHSNLRDASGNELLGRKIAAQSIPVAPSEEASFSISAEGVVIGNAKSMVSLLNAAGSGVTIKIRRIYITNAQTGAVTGIVAELQLRRFTGHSVGTALTADAMDSADALNAGVTARTGATITGEIARNLRRWFWSTDEWGPGTADTESGDHAAQALTPHYFQPDKVKPLTLRPGEGVHVKQNLNSTAGTFDLVIEFTQES